VSVVATTGVGVLARLLRRLGEGGGATVAEFAAAEGFARSTVFDVSRRMEAAGLLQRDLNGGMFAGPAAVKLALAEFGLAALHGPAETLLAQLRDETQGTARLMTDDGTSVLSFTARRNESDGILLDAPVTDRAKVTLKLRANATRAERDDAQLRLLRCATSLKHYLGINGDGDG
jgi:DNA-binding IclR family transcriptional regulator